MQFEEHKAKREQFKGKYDSLGDFGEFIADITREVAQGSRYHSGPLADGEPGDVDIAGNEARSFLQRLDDTQAQSFKKIFAELGHLVGLDIKLDHEDALLHINEVIPDQASASA